MTPPESAGGEYKNGTATSGVTKQSVHGITKINHRVGRKT
jgi:hypothetical protein